jgi:hypothetical protein
VKGDQVERISITITEELQASVTAYALARSQQEKRVVGVSEAIRDLLELGLRAASRTAD